MIKKLQNFKKETILTITLGSVMCLTSSAQIFQDSFETYEDFTTTSIGDWTLIDEDGLPTWGTAGVIYPNETYTGTAIIYNQTVATGDPDGVPSETLRPRTGDKGLYFASANPGPNDNYVISPQISLNNVTGASLSLYAKSLNNSFEPEQFDILVSTTGTDIANFTKVGDTAFPPTGVGNDNTVFTEYVFDLSSFDGQDIYIAIHHTSPDAVLLQIDDFTVTGNVLSTEDFSEVSFKQFYDVVSKQLQLNAKSPMNNLRLYNMAGKEVMSKSLSGDQETINLNRLSDGLYIAQLTTNKAVNNFKFIKR